MEFNDETLLANCIRKVLGVHDDSHVYLLPFLPGYAFPLIQGYGGSYSHTGPSHYGLDFAMPIGTPVCAARGGAVVHVVDHFDGGGADHALIEQCNVVRIQHADRSVATYAHLRKNGACARAGQHICAGEIIAYSGNTGWSTRPHLHFDVTAAALPSKVPTKFATHRNKAQFLQEGCCYSRRSSCHRLAILYERLPRLFSIILGVLKQLTRRKRRQAAVSVHTP